jgi:hypothetical protein
MTEQIRTWHDVKRFANVLTEDQLFEPVKVWGEGFCHDITSVQIMEEDHVNPSGDGAEPVSVYLNDPEYGQEFIDGETIVVKKGEIRLEAE